MNIQFPAVDEDFIKTMVEEGYYTNATELVRDAVRRLREGDTRKFNELKAALEIGERACRNGDVVEYTDKFLDECEAEAMKMVENGIAPNPDVCP